MYRILMLALLVPAFCLSDTLSVPVQQNPGTLSYKVTLTTPGKFEASFTRANGFGKTFYDLKSDPAKALNLAPIYTAGMAYSGLFWVKIGRADGSYEPNPPDSVTILEASSVRARIRLKGTHSQYGAAKYLWTGVSFEQIYTVYPNGNVYVSYVVESTKDEACTGGMAVITRSTGKWAAAGANQVHALGEFGPDAPKGATNTSWHLQTSNGPTYFSDILMVTQKGRYESNYWNEGYVNGQGAGEDYRTSFRLYSPLGHDTILTAGKHPLFYLMRFADDMNDIASANLYAVDYRTPDALQVSEGQSDKSSVGDMDADGFNEGEGCYVLTCGASGVRFTLTGSASVKRMSPSFRIKGWKWGPPASIQWGGATINRGLDFNAATIDGSLVMQVFRSVTGPVAAVVTGSGPGIRTDLRVVVPASYSGATQAYDLLGRQLFATGKSTFTPIVRITANGDAGVSIQRKAMLPGSYRE